jgi:polyhydroxybutyrate depolymerase
VTSATPRQRILSTSVLALVVAVSVVCAGCSSSSGASPRSGHTGSSAAVATGAPVPSSGCAQPEGPEITSQRENLDVDGTPRWYLLFTPSPGVPSPTRPTSSSSTTTDATSTVPRPLVLDFHGLEEGAVIHSITTRTGQLGQKDGFVVAFPNATGNPLQWNTTDQSPDTNPDLRYVTAVLGQIESTQCIDTSRVYASGLSDGSFMVSLLACTMSTRFAAIAAVSGLQLPVPCHTTRRVPILAYHGTADPILYFNGGVGKGTLDKILGRAPAESGSTTTTTLPTAHLNGAGYPATVKKWAVKDGCNPDATDTKVGSQVILRTYRCPPGTAVEFYIILGGGHAWPGSKFSRSITSITGFTTFEINATEQNWLFFRRFQL